jgi:hypothetical protein
VDYDDDMKRLVLDADDNDGDNEMDFTKDLLGTRARKVEFPDSG